MAQLHYLTVQDVLWINLQVTKKVQKFQFAKLEEATYYQYAYGPVEGVFAQAKRFITGFDAMKPFESGNKATAFVGAVSFLLLNGQTPKFADSEAKAWFAEAGIESGFEEADDDYHGSADPRAAIRRVLDAYPSAILELATQS